MAAVQAKFEPHDTPNEDVSEQSLLETAMSSGLLSNGRRSALRGPYILVRTGQLVGQAASFRSRSPGGLGDLPSLGVT